MNENPVEVLERHRRLLVSMMEAAGKLQLQLINDKSFEYHPAVGGYISNLIGARVLCSNLIVILTNKLRSPPSPQLESAPPQSTSSEPHPAPELLGFGLTESEPFVASTPSEEEPEDLGGS